VPDAIAGPLAAAAALLAIAGVEKIRRPVPTIDALRALGLDAPPLSARALGVVELAIGLGCLAAPSLVALDAALAALYAGFAGFVALLLLRGVEDVSCGCLGAEESRPSVVHLALNLACAGIGVAAVVAGPRDLPQVLSDTPLAGAPFVLAVATAAYLAYKAMTLLPRALSAYQHPIRGD
jgi:hypothetical protein